MSDARAGKWPGWIDSYDGASRTARVRIDGLTEGSPVLPVAVFEYPIGDRADASDSKDHTEIRILPNDPVWIEFECGDERFPIVTGSRLKREGNPTNWRRWRHANIEMTADNVMRLNAKRLEFVVEEDWVTTVGGKQTTDVTGAMESTAATSKHTAATHLLTANTTIAGAMSNVAGAGGGIGMTMNGGTFQYLNMTITYTGCSITSNGKKIDHTHTHTEQGDGAEVSTPH